MGPGVSEAPRLLLLEDAILKWQAAARYTVAPLEQRGIATRYDQTTRSFASLLNLSAVGQRLESCVDLACWRACKPVNSDAHELRRP